VAYTALGGGLGHATSPVAVVIAVGLVAGSALASLVLVRHLTRAAGTVVA
jgi:hypothetical protein